VTLTSSIHIHQSKHELARLDAMLGKRISSLETSHAARNKLEQQIVSTLVIAGDPAGSRRTAHPLFGWTPQPSTDPWVGLDIFPQLTRTPQQDALFVDARAPTGSLVTDSVAK